MPKNKAAFDHLVDVYLPSLPQEDTFITSQSEMLACMLYPHFYQVYYYEPEVKASEVLDEQFKAGNWYAPSAAEWARIVYYRGYSAAGANFVRDEEDQALKAQISKTITNGKTPQTTPVFSLVANSGMTALPAVWTSLYDSKAAYRTGSNITTSEYTSGTNNIFFGYLYNWGGGSYAGWFYGYNPRNTPGADGNALGAEYYWRARKQQGLPLVQYKYSKPV